MRKYVFLGDSLIYGYGVSPKDNWVYKLKNTLNLNLYNKGINGSTTTDMLIRFEEDVLSLNPTDVFIMGGTNDLLSNRSVQSIINNIELMIEDKPANINKISGKIPVICFHAGYNKNCDGGNIIRCYSWYDIYIKIYKLLNA